MLAAAACTNGVDRAIESEPVDQPGSESDAESDLESTSELDLESAPESNEEPNEESGSTSQDEVTTRDDWTTCNQIAVDAASEVQEPGLVETSGLAASVQHDGVLWAHNDSGSAAGVYAVGLDGSHRGFFALDGVSGVDVEDMALVDGRMYLADIGDNSRRRATIEIHVFDEPTPTAPGDATQRSVGPVATVTARYPDGPTDAEAILVDPVDGELLVLSKDLDDGDAQTRLYAVPLEFDTAEPVEMTLVGSVDVGGLNSQSTEFSITAILFPGQVTAADVSTDGRIIALRTYGSVWLFPRRPAQTMAEALDGIPCEGGTAAEGQGESIAFLPPSHDDPGSASYVTVSEGAGQPINIVTVELG